MPVKALLVIAITFLGQTALADNAGDKKAGQQKAKVCAACHGMKGISASDIWPNLAGQKYGYLVKQTKAFRDGDRKDPSMQPMVQGLSDQDIADISAYYSSLK